MLALTKNITKLVKKSKWTGNLLFSLNRSETGKENYVAAIVKNKDGYYCRTSVLQEVKKI